MYENLEKNMLEYGLICMEEIEHTISKVDNLKYKHHNNHNFWKKFSNELPMHAQCTQEGTRQKNILYPICIFHTYIVCCQLKKLHGCLRHMLHFCTAVSPFHDTIVQMP